jgi:hypothetical protein
VATNFQLVDSPGVAGRCHPRPTKQNRREDLFQPGIFAPATTPGEVPQRCPRSWAERSHLCEPGGGAASVVRFWEAIKVVTRTLQSSFSGGSAFLFCGIASLGGLARILSREIDLLFSRAGVASRSSSRCRLWDDGCGDLGGIWVVPPGVVQARRGAGRGEAMALCRPLVGVGGRKVGELSGTSMAIAVG